MVDVSEGVSMMDLFIFGLVIESLFGIVFVKKNFEFENVMVLQEL